jgi:hypothetical protein
MDAERNGDGRSTVFGNRDAWILRNSLAKKI